MTDDSEAKTRKDKLAMTFTDMGTKVPWDWCPVALANGVEWSNLRAGFPDRFDCLYRYGIINKILWFAGAAIAVCGAKL